MEPWRQCGRWLVDCKVLPPNHRVVWPSAVVFDLAQALRDGVLLCQLLHNLSPGSIDLKDINFRPQMSQVRVRARREGPWPRGVRAAGREDADAEVAPMESPGTVAGAAGLGGRGQAAGRGAERERGRRAPWAFEPVPPRGNPGRRKVDRSPPSPGRASARGGRCPGASGVRGDSSPGGAPTTAAPAPRPGLRGPASVSADPGEPAALGGLDGRRAVAPRAGRRTRWKKSRRSGPEARPEGPRGSREPRAPPPAGLRFLPDPCWPSGIGSPGLRNLVQREPPAPPPQSLPRHP